MEDQKNIKIDFSGIIKSNPCGFIIREKIGEASGGILSPGYAANLDSAGKGIKGRFKVGRKVAYPAHAVVEFLEERAQLV
ncbi:MAG: hypothetical protein RBR67_17400 [Desulfobacterium sp.]|jgi:hypothetical protein|nr:hypothetical protein [Desulfobacterium sp.]